MKTRPRVAAPYGPEALAAILAQELKLYREMYILADRQRDCLQEKTDIDLCDLLSEAAEIQTKIEESETAVRAIAEKAGPQFEEWTKQDTVAAYLDRIRELILRTREIVIECAAIAEGKRAAYREELNQMGIGRVLLKNMGSGPELARYVDQSP